MPLSVKSQKILKFAHIFTACCWIGGNASLLTLSFLKLGMDDAKVLLGANIAGMWVDWIVVIALGALGCLLTGIIYSVATPWGFIKHRWVIVKWIMTIGMITYGISFLGPSKAEMLSLNKELLDGIFESARYAELQLRHLLGSPLQIIGLLFTTFISIVKPWRKKEVSEK